MYDCESLEDRRMLAGVVNVVWPGGGTLALLESATTPGSDNQVQLQSTANAGEYRVTGLNGTQVQLNGAGLTAPDVLVNAVFGDITINLGQGSDYAEVAAGTTIPTNLSVISAGAPASGRTLLRVVNAAADAGALDVYLTGSDEPLSSAVPVLAGAEFGEEFFVIIQKR